MGGAANKNDRKFLGFAPRELVERGRGASVIRQNPADFVRNTFELCSIHTASWEMKSLARPLRGLASRFSEKFQAVLNSVRPKRAFLEILYEFCYNSIVVSITQVMISKH